MKRVRASSREGMVSLVFRTVHWEALDGASTATGISRNEIVRRGAVLGIRGAEQWSAIKWRSGRFFRGRHPRYIQREEHRLAVALPADVHAKLKSLAKKNRVALNWLLNQGTVAWLRRWSAKREWRERGTK